jgi:hypothetical protein
MKPNEVAAISIQEHLKIKVTERTTNGNVTTHTSKVVMSQRVK